MTRRIAPAALAALLAAMPAVAANKDIDRLAMQIASLQGQLAEIQRVSEENRAELRRLTELIAEQNALLKKGVGDRQQQAESAAAGLKDLGDRVAEVAESVQALRSQIAPLLGPPAGAPPAPAATAGGSPGGTATPGSAPPTATAAAPAAPAPAPRELYSQAYADFARGNYDLAIQGFTEYIRDYPDTDFTDNAQYWIGECLYGKKMFAEAIEAWNTLFKDYPTSDKLADARVKKGMALERLGRRSQALVEYRYVVDRYPSSQAARIAREHLTP
ncbi:MAG TPA: tol-pal system protein YbgF [Vicinamibacteria bacterium]|nr:tol-pal system protein YbgF [Vicinamibacteria bacterium]